MIGAGNFLYTKITSFALMFAISLSPAWCNDSLRIAVAAESPSAPSAVRLSGAVQLSPEAMSMAQQLKLFDRIGHLAQLKEEVAMANSEHHTIESVALRQEVEESKQSLTRKILRTALEADYVVSAIDGEQNDCARLTRALSNRRDTSILINTVLSQLVNGIFWTLSGSFTLVGIDHAQAGNVDGVSSIIAGSIPAMLGLFALYQANGPKKTLVAHPNMLAPLFSSATTSDGYYPDSVLAFLEAVPAGEQSKQTRKEALIGGWMDNNLIGKGGALTTDARAAMLSGTVGKRRALTISLLQARQTMLSDLRTVVCQMKRGLVELMPLVE